MNMAHADMHIGYPLTVLAFVPDHSNSVCPIPILNLCDNVEFFGSTWKKTTPNVLLCMHKHLYQVQKTYQLKRCYCIYSQPKHIWPGPKLSIQLQRFLIARSYTCRAHSSMFYTKCQVVTPMGTNNTQLSWYMSYTMTSVKLINLHVLHSSCYM